MIRSMTGFGAAEHTRGGAVVKIVTRSVNSRHLDVAVRLPDGYLELESSIRRAVTQILGRGRIDIAVSVGSSGTEKSRIRFEKKAFTRLMALYREVASELSEKEIALEVLRRPEVLTVEQAELAPRELERIVTTVLKESLRKLMLSRRNEGVRLESDLRKRLKSLVLFYKVVSKRSRIIDAAQRRQSQAPMTLELREQVRERYDIAEELTRLESHLELFRKTMRDDSPGKKLEFILQELTREVNTLGAKSGDMQLIHAAVEMKAVIEKMKEQVQNVE